MTAGELITLADGLCPNVFSTGVKVHLINQIEHRIREDVLLLDPDAYEDVAAADIATAELSLQGYDDLYLAWMKAMYYWNMGEYEVYENERAMFNSCFERLKHDVAVREHAGSCGREYVT